MPRNITLIVLSILLPLLALGQDTPKTHYTLEECIDLALKYNANAQKSATQRDLAELDLKQAKANLLPNLNGGLNHGINTGLVTNPLTNTKETANITSGSQSLGSSVILFNGLNLLRTIRQQALAAKAYQFDEQRVKDNLTMDVILAYLQVISTRDILEQSKQQRDVTQKQLERLAILYEKGEGAPGDFFDIKGQLSGDQVNVLTSENTLKNNIIALTQLMNIPYSDSLHFAGVNPDPTANYDSIDQRRLYQRAAEHLGILRSAEYFKQSAEMGLKATRSLYAPTLSLGGNLYSTYSNTSPVSYYQQIKDNYGRGISLNLDIPILNGFYRRINVAKAKLTLRNAEIDLENTRNTLQQQSAQVLINLKTSKEKYQEQQAQVDAYQESFRIAQVKFEAGAINSVEFLQQKNKYDNATINTVISQYEWILRQHIANYYHGGSADKESVTISLLPTKN